MQKLKNIFLRLWILIQVPFSFYFLNQNLINLTFILDLTFL